jgi:retron-type reverse transcriptase
MMVHDKINDIIYKNVSDRLKVAVLINVAEYHLKLTLYSKGLGRNQYYRIKNINKSNGKIRTIHAVTSYLKTTQKKTLEFLSNNYSPTRYAKGFVKGSSIIENAKLHRNKKFLLKIDLKDFFPSISFARVMGMFQAPPFMFSKDMAVIFAQICCLDDNGPIPQGGVTSPYISNMICRKLDSRLSKLAINMRIDYSRYADDMTFSTDKNIDFNKFLKIVQEIIEDEGFEINESKTRFLKKSNRQIVTGIVVNEGLNVNRKYINNIRAILHNCYINGVVKEMTRSDIKDTRNTCSPLVRKNINEYTTHKSNKIIDKKKAKHIFLTHLLGRIQFVGQVARANKKLNKDHYDRRVGIYENLMDKYKSLCIKEKLRGPQYFLALKELEKCRKIEVIKEIKQISAIQKLDEIVDDLANNDPRFFVFTYNRSKLKYYKNEVIKKLEYPPFDQTYLTTILSSLKDSQSVLGGLCHDIREHQITQDFIMKFINTFEVHYKYKLSYEPRITIKEFLDKIEKKILNTNSEQKLNLFSEEDFRDKTIIPFKKNTRFGRDDTSTNISVMIDEVFSETTKNYNKDNVLVHSFYTYVPAIKNSMELILRSMNRHSKSKRLILSITRDTENNLILISISDTNTHEIDSDCIRDNLVHGKMKSVIRILNGIGDYYFIANFKNKGWFKINLMKGNTIDRHKEMGGVTHLITLPAI